MLKPTLHLMVGLLCAGKTTRAKKLEKECNLIRFTPDEWQLRLLGDTLEDFTFHNKIHDEIETIMWELAQSLLSKAISVVLDYGFWAREEREFFFQKAKELNVNFKVHFMDITLEKLFERLEIRNADPNYLKFVISKKNILEWHKIFQPVSDEELKYYMQ